MSAQNLDQLCARYGYEIAQEVHNALKKGADNLITKSLGVLQENGVYAFFLYQNSRGQREKPGAEKIKEQAHALLKTAEIRPFDTEMDALKAVRGGDGVSGLASQLNDLLLAKRLLEQTLIYARYHAKAVGSTK